MTSPKVLDSGPSPKLLEEIFGQVLFCVGVGAGHIRIRREAVRLLIDTYRDKFTEVLSKDSSAWENTGHCALEHFGIVGRLAAQYAVDKGKVAIEPDAMDLAIKRVDGVAKAALANVSPDRAPWCLPRKSSS